MTKKLQECPECGARTGQDDTEAHYLDCAKRCGKQNKLQELIEGFGYLLIRVREDRTLEFEPHVFKHKLMEIAQLAEEEGRKKAIDNRWVDDNLTQCDECLCMTKTVTTYKPVSRCGKCFLRKTPLSNPKEDDK